MSDINSGRQSAYDHGFEDGRNGYFGALVVWFLMGAAGGAVSTLCLVKLFS